MECFNIGTFLKFPLNELNNNILLNKDNEIIITMNISEHNDNTDIYFLDNTFGHDHLKELNEYNTKLYINGQEFKYKKYLSLKKGDYIQSN